MLYRLSCKVIVCVFFVSLLSLPVFSQWEDVTSFKDVQIPFDLKYEDKIIKKGTYKVEILKDTKQTVYYLRIRQGSKRLCLVPGEYLQYMVDAQVPAKPKLRMRKNTEEKLLYLIFESGTITFQYPNIKIRFKMEYVD
ncbi:MAG: hypothetical protein WBF32_10055 [Candidatus Aminicenantaceae bacterium]